MPHRNELHKNGQAQQTEKCRRPCQMPGGRRTAPPQCGHHDDQCHNHEAFPRHGFQQSTAAGQHLYECFQVKFHGLPSFLSAWLMIACNFFSSASESFLSDASNSPATAWSREPPKKVVRILLKAEWLASLREAQGR